MSTKNNPLGDYGKLLKTLNRYSDDTRMRFLKIVDEQNIDLKDAREFIMNTQKYNSNARKVFNAEKKRLEDEWQLGLSEKQKHDLFEEDGSRLTKRGFDIRRRYVDSRMGDLYPERMKSIVPSTMQMDRKGFQEMAETRAKMAKNDYFDKRIDIYVDNYESALRRHFEDDGYFGDIYASLTKEQKLEILKNTSGRIQFVYQNSEDAFFDIFAERISELDLTSEQIINILDRSSSDSGATYLDMFKELITNKTHDYDESFKNELLDIAQTKDMNIYYDLADEFDIYRED